MIYRCYNGAVKGKHCDGQTVYSAARIETEVLNIVRQYFNSLKQTIDTVWAAKAKEQLQNRNNSGLQKAEADMARLVKQRENLKEEVHRTIAGEGRFDIDLLNTMITENKEAIRQVLKPSTNWQEHSAVR